MLGEDQRLRLGRGVVAVATAALLSVLAGCSDAGSVRDTTRGPDAAASSRSSGSPSSSPSLLAAKPVPRPPTAACYRLSYDDAVSPTSDARPVDCGREHTARTFAVGRLANVVDGHLLAVDSDRVQSFVATTCRRRFGAWVGGDLEDRRLTMLGTVWFTPSLAQSDRGADWYRCDVVALAAPERLALLKGRLAGVLATAAGRARFAMCGTAAPDSAEFQRVVCTAPHTWRAVAVVELPDGPYPGERAVRATGERPCEDVGRQVADDPLEFQWGYEWPTAERWAEGQAFGRCWVPD